MLMGSPVPAQNIPEPLKTELTCFGNMQFAIMCCFPPTGSSDFTLNLDVCGNDYIRTSQDIDSIMAHSDGIDHFFNITCRHWMLCDMCPALYIFMKTVIKPHKAICSVHLIVYKPSFVFTPESLSLSLFQFILKTS